MGKKQFKSRQSSESKTAAMLIRLEPGEKEAFRVAAELSGIDVSAWMRERLRKAARQELEEAQLPIPFLRHVLEELRLG